MTKPSPARRLLSIAERFPSKNIYVLGDLMLDHFIRGSVLRISPEAPVPVVAVSEESFLPGGAGNVCCNIAALGARVCVFGVLGRDAAGRQLLSDLRSRGVDASGIIADPGRVSTQKSRVVAEHQQVVRFDRETPKPLSTSLQERLLRSLESRIGEADALVLSDYGKGMLTRTVLRRAILAAHRAAIPVLVDPKIEHFRRYKGADCVTPNLQEAWQGMRVLAPKDEPGVRELGKRICRVLKTRSLLITRGERGMTLFEGGGSRIRHIPTQAKEVYDVTGAGDTVIGVMALALASGARPYEAAVTANLAAGVVVGKLGTATLSLAELRAALRGWRP